MVKTDGGCEMVQIESMMGQCERNQILEGISNRMKVWDAFVKFLLIRIIKKN